MDRYIQKNIACPEGMVQIPGFPRYYINRKGDVWSQCSGKYLKSIGSGHYNSIALYEKSNVVYWSRAKALLVTFVRLPNPGEYARHLNDDKSNDSLENLAWGSQKQNAEDAVRNGRLPRGEGHYKAKLFPLDVVNILVNYGKKQALCKTFAEAYGVSWSTIGSICAGDSWKHIYRIVMGKSGKPD